MNISILTLLSIPVSFISIPSKPNTFPLHIPLCSCSLPFQPFPLEILFQIPSTGCDLSSRWIFFSPAPCVLRACPEITDKQFEWWSVCVCHVHHQPRNYNNNNNNNNNNNVCVLWIEWVMIVLCSCRHFISTWKCTWVWSAMWRHWVTDSGRYTSQRSMTVDVCIVPWEISRHCYRRSDGSHITSLETTSSLHRLMKLISLLTGLYVCLSTIHTCLSVCLSLCLSLCISVCLSVCLYLYSFYLSLCVCLFVLQSAAEYHVVCVTCRLLRTAVYGTRLRLYETSCAVQDVLRADFTQVYVWYVACVVMSVV